MIPSSELSIQKKILEELQQSEAVFERSSKILLTLLRWVPGSWTCRKIVQFLLAEDDFDQLFQGLIGTGNSS